jgi:epoxyqueuosine reductase
MKWHDLNPILLKWAETRSYRAVWAPVSAVARAFERVATFRSAGVFENDLYRHFLSWMDDPKSLPSPEEKSIIVVAVPRPAHVVTFDYRGKSFELILPPTYYNYRGLFEEVREDLEILFERRFALRKITAPLKSLAAVTGLARYGLNNIAYVDGCGSYVQLMAFAIPVEVEGCNARTNAEPMVLDECRDCRACYRVCPAGAIHESRFLLHAEQCLTYFSEKEGALPDEYGRLKKSCLVGCMACQAACPVNKGRLRLEKIDVHFTESETEYLIGNDTAEPAPSIRSKVAALKSNEFDISTGSQDTTLRRNLRTVLEWQWSHPKKARP